MLSRKCRKDPKIGEAFSQRLMLNLIGEEQYFLNIFQEVEREAAAVKWKLIADNAAACGIDVEALLS